jgi:predicted Zn-dependent protease
LIFKRLTHRVFLVLARIGRGICHSPVMRPAYSSAPFPTENAGVKAMPIGRSAAVALATMVAGLLLVACDGAQSRRATHIGRGQAYFAAGNFAKASVEFRSAIQIAPNDPQALVLAGRAAERLGQITEAAGLYQAAMNAAPDYAPAQANLGRMYVFGGLPDRALEILESALAKHPNDADLLAARSGARFELNNLAEARADAERAVQLAPTNENALSLLAGLYQRAGEYPRAVALIEGALRQSPASTELRQVLVGLYLAGNEPDKAEEELRKLIELKPREFPYRFQLALFYERQHKLDDAQRVLEAAVKALPANSDVKLALVDFMTTQRTFAQAEKTLQDFIARDPNNYQLRLGLGMLYQRNGAIKQSLDIYNEVIRHDGTGPDGLIARDRVAEIEIFQGRIAEAQQHLAEVLQTNPRDNQAMLLRGNIALQHNNPMAAIADLRGVLRDQPESVGAQLSLARAFLANSEPELAEGALRAALASAPTDASVRIELAQFLAQTNRAGAAVALLEETVRGDPTNASAREALTRAYIAKRDFVAARTAAEDLKTLRPRAAAGPYLAAIIARAENRLGDSQKELEHALQLQPNAVDVLAALSRLQLEQGQGASAVARVEAAVQAEPKNALVRNLLGELLIATKAYPEAIAQLTQAAQIAPGWWQPYRNLVAARIATGDTAGAIASCEAGVKAIPFQPELVADLAALYERRGHFEEAIALYDGLYTHNPHLQIAANNLAMLLVTYRTDQPSLERAHNLTATFAGSDNGAFLDTYGWVRLKNDDPREALASLERAASRSPESKLIRFHLAMAQLKVGQRDKARTNLEAALSGTATFAGSNEARAILASLTHGRVG